MDPLSDFKACDQLNVTLSGNISSDPPVITPGPLNPSGQAQCVPKTPDAFSFTLLPTEFGLPDLPVSLTFQGAPAGVDGGGNPLVTWSVDRAYDLPITINGYNVRIKHIKGQVTLALTSIPNPTSMPGCGGDCHSHVVQFFSPSKNDSVDVDVWVDTAGGQSGTVHVKNLVFVGTAAKAVGRDLSIQLRKDNCGVGAVEGGIAQLTSNLGAYANPKFKWEVSGASLATNETGTSWAARIQVPAPAVPFTVTLTVTDGACTVSRRLTVNPLTVREASLIEEICHLMMEYTLINLFWNPLGPDVRLPLTEGNVLKIREAAERVVGLTDAWLGIQRIGAIGAGIRGGSFGGRSRG